MYYSKCRPACLSAIIASIFCFYVHYVVAAELCDVKTVERCWCKECYGKRKHPYTAKERELATLLLTHPLGIRSDDRLPLIELVFAYCGRLKSSWLAMPRIKGVFSIGMRNFDRHQSFSPTKISSETPMIPCVVVFGKIENQEHYQDTLEALIHEDVPFRFDNVQQLKHFVEAGCGSMPSVRSRDMKKYLKMRERMLVYKMLSICNNYKIVAHKNENDDVIVFARMCRLKSKERILELLKK